MDKRNLGRIYIERRMVENEPERVAEVFAILKLIPVRAELLYTHDKFEYVAISDRFEHVPTGTVVPDYDLEISVSNEVSVSSVDVKRVK